MYASVDEQGVGIIHKIKPGGLTYRLFKKDPFEDKELIIDGSKPRELGTKKIQFLRVGARKGTFHSTGKTNYTVRIHIVKEESNKDSIVGVNNAIKQGFLCSPQDMRDVEYTAIVRVKGIKKKSESLVVKIRGSEHIETPEKTLCCGMNFPYTKAKVHNDQLYEREYTHPDYQFKDVEFKGDHPDAGENWLLIKVICYNVEENGRIFPYMETYYNKNPFNKDGSVNNNPNDLKLYWIATDKADQPPTWGGKIETLRADMLENLDIAYLSCYEIMPPGQAENQPPVIAGPMAYTFEPNTQAEILQSCSDDNEISLIIWDGLENLIAPTTSPDNMNIKFTTPAEEKTFDLAISVTDSGGLQTTKTIPVTIRAAKQQEIS